jgi:hypothetical protein
LNRFFTRLLASALALVCLFTLQATYAQIRQRDLISPGNSPVKSAGPVFRGDPAKQKLALLIGVSGYAQGITSLETSGDVDDLAHVLKERYGFSQPVVLKTPEETTRASILQALERLITQTPEGGLVYIHYSGHGSQVPDTNGDELGDGLDETWVPSDAHFLANGDLTQQISDDEFYAFMKRLAAKSPALVTVSVDACHSGSFMRGSQFLSRSIPYRGPKQIAETASVIAMNDKNKQGVSIEKLPSSAPFVFLYAAQSHQTAAEDSSQNPAGMFSHALIEGLLSLPANSNYLGLLAFTRNQVIQRGALQTPYGDGQLETVLLGTEVSYTEPVVKVAENGKLKMEAGSLQGITVDSEYEVTPLQPEGEKMTFKAKVIYTEPFTAYLEPETKGLLHDFQGAVKEITHASPVKKLKLKTSSKELRDKLAKLGSVSLTEGSDWELLLENKKTGVSLYRQGGLFAKTVASVDLEKALAQEQRWQAVRNLRSQGLGQTRSLSVEIVPVKGHTHPVTNEFVKEDELASTELLKQGQIKEGQPFVIRIKNASDKAQFVTIISLEQDGDIHVLFPESGDDPLIHALGVREPGRILQAPVALNENGQEYLVAVGTPHFVDLRFLQTGEFSKIALKGKEVSNELIAHLCQASGKPEACGLKAARLSEVAYLAEGWTVESYLLSILKRGR